MCGIVGFVDRSNTTQKEQVIKEMMDTIVHRGPNSSGQFIDEGVALGFRRLSIIDLEGGSQPIYNEDETKIITFNGEIYNYQSIREDLIAKGHIFRTHADTEVLLHGYEEYGVELLQKIRGMFAFVIWDTEKQELFGARDHFGIKPLYYAQMNGTFMYGSEIKSFLKHPNFVKELNKEALKPYMTFQYSALDETFFKNVYRIKEGHYFTYKDGELKIEQYWDVDEKETDLTLDETVDLIDKTVVSSVEAHRIADVEVGSFLSSGVDSSYVTAVLRPEHSYSIGFGDKTYNESVEAKKLAELINLNNTSRVVTGDEAFDYFPLIQYHLDEPDSNPSCVPLYFLAELASRDVRVALSGEGADELFAGYQAYGMNTNSKMVKVVAEGLKKLPKGMRYKIGRGLKGKTFRGALHLYTSLAPAEDFFIGQAKVFEEEEAVEYLQPTYQSSPSVKDIVQVHYDQVQDMSEIKKMQYLDMHQWMPKDILLKADKLSMASSLEVRVPLLDKELMKVSEQVPTKYLINAENTKYAFRQAAARHLPEEWYNREKLGFPVPIKDWLREEKYYKIIRNLFEQEFVKEFFDQEKILKLLDDNFEGKADGRRKIWTIYTFLTWYQVYFINDGEKPVPAPISVA
ncbi:asparagine synthase (glutamine-hydrolyzing) [Enterococcus pallens]|uniref:asparagine synthase (glutamine-hydrolyzing) n=1 Tax=Enterococcus pallens ATCC BAA-351 TaxID=1158607 RepID=R2SBI5_9ENTE|nr:asparagine synthase (glutamine-hydrolyzing) [Enterococcus pallens]EOH90216.1 asparagine synthase (glutamine-hydrolyzing) [Enterococcus pallens ATCC BAA-351]EOU15178.1 asparagine synthase (glutamine-hydrolyzing) [Enterococcus pallens ATCC BAA-351]OJG79090.1 asparagine synthase (glutamine-hydrolyzing) [Enterococcus pallens]